MELVEWLDSAQPEEREAREIVRALGLDDGQARELLDRWREWIADEQIRATLSAHGCAERLASLARLTGANLSLSLRREWMFATRDAQGRIIRGQIDRIVIARDAGGEVVAAEIVDYKTDRLSAAAVERRAAAHADQVRQYATAVGRITAAR